ncbi:hypothetical protein [Rhabdaerophilum calidifontis]|uniref:hypothetical protein n=1 Tax=Rhabdaerophilum calidifontis TaxID=2604328 RepID=UPI001FE86BC2|nr:hypothetical protein [Rhabdaerophilum calidifontis]
MPMMRVTLHLARSKEHPQGSSAHGYEIVAPLDAEGRLDPDLWKENRAACRVRRFWADEEYDLGHLVHRGGGRGGSWAFTYDIAGDEDDEAGYRLGNHRFDIGEYVSIRDDDGVMHTFEVALVEPA